MDAALIISLLVITHFIADFMMQSDNMTKNKSKSNKVLLSHVSIYTIAFMVLVSPLYGLVNGILHFAIDYVTSRRTARLWAEGRVHDFFVTIGFDQMLHMLSLIWTYYFLIG